MSGPSGGSTVPALRSERFALSQAPALTLPLGPSCLWCQNSNITFHVPDVHPSFSVSFACALGWIPIEKKKMR